MMPSLGCFGLCF